MSQSRRFFLKSSGLAMASFAAVPSFLVRTAMAQGTTASKDRPILIAIFQRGAADGVSVVPSLRGSQLLEGPAADRGAGAESQCSRDCDRPGWLLWPAILR
jgi:uncharacterized protein (DUF1501 family)